MRKFNKSLIHTAEGQFGELHDKMLINNHWYDKTTLTPIERSENERYNQYNRRYAGFYATHATRNMEIFAGGGFQHGFDGIGGFCDNWGGFSINCSWQEPVNMPIYDFETEHYYYRYAQDYDRTSWDAGPRKYFKNTGEFKHSWDGNNWGSQSLTIQSDIDKNRFLIYAPYSAYERIYMYQLSIDGSDIRRDYDYWDYQHALGPGNVLVNNEHEVIMCWSRKNSQATGVLYYNKDSRIYRTFRYMHPDPLYVNNTSGQYPVKLTSTNEIVNHSNIMNNMIHSNSELVDKIDDIHQYYMCRATAAYSNDYAPFVATYVDSEGVTQDVDMGYGIQSNASRYSSFFSLYRLNIDTVKGIYYHDIIDIDWSSYPEANMWDVTDTASRKESLLKNVHFDKQDIDGTIHSNCEWVDVNGDKYLIAIINHSWDAGNKCVFCTFTMSGNTATLVGTPLILREIDDWSLKYYFCKKLDNTGLNWHVLELNDGDRTAGKVYDIKWHPSTGWVNVDISAKWTNNGFYIDEYNRAWGVDEDYVLYVGNLYDEWIISTDIDPNSTIKWNGVDATTTIVNVHITDRQGVNANARSFNVVLDASSNNVTFDGTATTKEITTDINGYATFDLIVANEGNFNFHIDPV